MQLTAVEAQSEWKAWTTGAGSARMYANRARRRRDRVVVVRQHETECQRVLPWPHEQVARLEVHPCRCRSLARHVDDDALLPREPRIVEDDVAGEIRFVCVADSLADVTPVR